MPRAIVSLFLEHYLLFNQSILSVEQSFRSSKAARRSGCTEGGNGAGKRKQITFHVDIHELLDIHSVTCALKQVLQCFCVQKKPSATFIRKFAYVYTFTYSQPRLSSHFNAKAGFL